jgi:hypothetical protein
VRGIEQRTRDSHTASDATPKGDVCRAEGRVREDVRLAKSGLPSNGM